MRIEKFSAASFEPSSLGVFNFFTAEVGWGMDVKVNTCDVCECSFHRKPCS